MIVWDNDDITTPTQTPHKKLFNGRVGIVMGLSRNATKIIIGNKNVLNEQLVHMMIEAVLNVSCYFQSINK